MVRFHGKKTGGKNHLSIVMNVCLDCIFLLNVFLQLLVDLVSGHVEKDLTRFMAVRLYNR